MKRGYIILLVFFTGCATSGFEEEILGTWKWDDRTLTISEDRVVFNNVDSDFIEYEIKSDSTVIFNVEVGDGWQGKILSLNRNKIIYYDSLLQRQIELYRIVR